VKRKGEDDIPDWAPDWPQPQGIYVKGDAYKRIVICGERSVEYEAFGKVLQRRTTIDEDSSVLVFRLYELLMPPSTSRQPRGAPQRPDRETWV